MSVFIDTDVFYAHHDVDALHHEAARTFFDSVLEGAFGQPYTNEFILNEAVTMTRRQSCDVSAASAIANRILGDDPYPDVITFERVVPTILEDAKECLKVFDSHALSFTDAITIAHCRHRDIDSIASFDDRFDGIYERTDPTTNYS